MYKDILELAQSVLWNSISEEQERKASMIFECEY